MAGTIAAGGLSGPYEQWVCMRTGRFLTRYTLGPAPVLRGFDGQVAWQCGAGGEVAVQDSAAARQMAVTESFLLARGYWLAPHECSACAPSGEGIAGHELVQVHTTNGLPVQLWFDRAGSRLARTLQDVHGLEMAKRYEDHRDVGGLGIPFRIVTGTGDARRDVVVQLSIVELDPAWPEDSFDVPRQSIDDVAFIDGGSECSVPFEVAHNHVYLRVTLGGQDFQFLLDTGGVNLLTPETAARAGLQIEGALEARGPGEASVDAGFVRVDEFCIGDRLTMKHQLMRVLPLSGLEQADGHQCDGLLGHELFKRLVVTIDHAERRVTLTRPDAFHPPAHAHRLPLTFYAHIPTVNAMLDELPGQFWVDTGNRNALTLWRPFVQAHGLDDRYGAGDETVIGWGVGGAVRGRIACAGRLDLGGLIVEEPLLTLPSADSGPTATQGVAGNIGGDILRRYSCSFDYSRRTMHLASIELRTSSLPS
ncbi:aspartyl protease family protein [Piscinibacter terrae]|nr:aspartyl protease family protein [Albitalea terrae]